MIARSGTYGEHVTFWTYSDPSEPALGQYMVKLLRQLGYRASLRIVNGNRYWGIVGNSNTKAQVGLSWWYIDYPTPGGFFLPVLSCHSFAPHSTDNQNLAEYCNPAFDRLMTRALNTQATNPAAANLQWVNIDRRVSQAAPWVPLFTQRWTGFVSKRVRNYQYDPEWAVLLAQLWVR
jgi:ABC-type transport system substrate-binding protein